MKIVKSLLLGTAAGFVAVAGAQAADMPVKAKPVEYVKICTLYGAGYYYIPGSDTCIKIGGYVRADYGWNVGGARTPAYSGTQGAQDRTVAQYSTRHRANLSIDTRTQTQYGTLRTLSSIHVQNENGTESFNVARAMIQWAGFTFGRIQSFQDTWNVNDSWHLAQQQNNSDTGANGVNAIAYTFDMGNGFTLTFGADERRSKSVTNLSRADAIKIGSEPTTSLAGEQYPDPYVNFRIDQAWGFWSSTFVGHNDSTSYYTCGIAYPAAAGLAVPLTTCGHPANAIGWAGETGAEVKLPQFGPADRMGATFRYAQGASGYGGGSTLGSAALFGSGNNVAVGQLTDGVYVNGSGIELTTTWTVAAGYEHSWTPTVKSSFTGAYTQVLYDANAKAMYASNVCGGVAYAANGTATSAGGQAGFNGGSGATLASNCNPDWSFFQGGIRTMWTPIPGFFLAVDTLYTQVWTAFGGTTAMVAGASTSGTSGAITAVNPVIGGRPSGIYSINNQGIWSFIFRAQRNFNAGD